MNQETNFEGETLNFGVSLRVLVINIPNISMPSLLWVAYTGFSILVKQRGARDKPLGRQVN